MDGLFPLIFRGERSELREKYGLVKRAAEGASLKILSLHRCQRRSRAASLGDACGYALYAFFQQVRYSNTATREGSLVSLP